MVVLGGNEYTDKTARDLRGRGFIVANVDYRYVSNSVHANDLLNDIQSAFEFLKKKGKQYKFRQQGYHLAGISAGANLALLYGYTSNENIKSISALCPPTMLDNAEIMSALEKNKLVKNVELLADAKYISGEAINSRFSEVSPYYHTKLIPTLLFHGDKDDLVPDSQSRFLFKRLQQKKITSKFVPMVGKGHDCGMNQVDSEKIVLDEIESWIKEFN